MSTFSAPKSPLRAVAFDLDGLLFNTEDIYQAVGSVVLERRGKLFTAELMDQMIGRPSPIALQLMIDFHQLTDSVEQLAAESSEAFNELIQTQLQPMPGVVKLLDALNNAQIPRGIVTSSARPLALRVLDVSRLTGEFDFVIAADDIKLGKPHPEPYLLAAERLGVASQEMLVLEDSAHGACAGVASGAYTVAVPSGHTLGHAFDGVQFVAHTLLDERIWQSLGLTPQ